MTSSIGLAFSVQYGPIVVRGLALIDHIVAACSPCNLRKGNLTPRQARMLPRQHPFAPTVHQLHRNGRLFPPNYLHDSWLDYLDWDTELDP